MGGTHLLTTHLKLSFTKSFELVGSILKFKPQVPLAHAAIQMQRASSTDVSAISGLVLLFYTSPGPTS